MCLLHIFAWAFIILAFLNKETAKLNLYYVIPFVYVLHILPFHVLMQAKQNMYKTDWKKRVNEVSDALIIPTAFVKLQDQLDLKCFASPMSPQGLLIFGAISSAWSLK
jgi:hypothetical protein